MIEQVEMVDGRVYSTVDGWVTVYVTRRGGRKRKVGKEEADRARFLAIMQQEGGG